MSDKGMVENAREAGKPAQQPGDRELLLKVVMLQTMLNSKMFEFMREYQQQDNWGTDRALFRDGSGRKTKVANLFDEVNQIGCLLSEAVSAFAGERLYEKRDENGRVVAFCTVCEKETPFRREIDSPYGMLEAYFRDCERLVCTICDRDTIYPGDERLPRFNSIFRTR